MKNLFGGIKLDLLRGSGRSKAFEGVESTGSKGKKTAGGGGTAGSSGIGKRGVSEGSRGGSGVRSKT